MALFQIAEPRQSPHREHKLAIGIDLGTTNPLVASVRSMAAVLNDERRRPCYLRWSAILPTAAPKSDTPHTHQALDPKHHCVGQTLHGRGWDIRNRESVLMILSTVRGMVRLKTVAGTKTPVEVSAKF